MKPQNSNDTIKKINQLYVMTRKKYIFQKGDAYITMDGDKFDKTISLTDTLIKRHLDGKDTYGVFNANVFNKFITFDIDFADDMPMARWATGKLVDVLYSDFGIPYGDIHVSYSGNKGYHIDLFFDKSIKLSDAILFYKKVCIHADLTDKQLEFRPTYKQGVKLPLGVHQKTGNRCWFVDRATLNPIESFDYLNEIEPMDHTIILDALIELTQEPTEGSEAVVRATDRIVNVVAQEEAFSKVRDVLTAGRLLYSGSRHDTTVMLASFYNSQGFERDKAKGVILDVLYATPPEFFNKTTTRELIDRETNRIVNLAYDSNYTLGNADQRITIYKSEILAVLKVGTFRQKQLAYAMLVTSKRYGSVFYLTMNTGMAMLGTSAKQTVATAIKKLIEVGFIEYVRKGELDKAYSKCVGYRVFKPNQYRILVEQPQADEQFVEIMSDQSLVEVSHLLLTKGELRKCIGRSEFDNRWNKAFKGN